MSQHSLSGQAGDLQPQKNDGLPLRPTASAELANGASADPTDEHQVILPQDDLGADDEDKQERDYGIASNLPPADPQKKKKKKKKTKPASKRGLGAPTGFEDFFADTPPTPEEHSAEKDLYHTSVHFIDRILTAIARFERTRKLTPERRDILYKYLTYGGVEVGPNSFQGGKDLSSMDKSTIQQILSNASITEEKRNLDTDTSTWTVDFLTCMKGFLSRNASNLVRLGFEQRSDVELVTTTLERFLDYLLQHDVCIEYQAEVLATRNFCREATSELWDMAQATRRLPGEFNIACSTLFNGSYADRFDGETWWGLDEVAETEPVFVGLKPEEANQILHFGVSGAATEDVFTHYLAAVNGTQTLEVVAVLECTGFEITRIEAPSKECIQIYSQHSTHFRPVGRVYAKPWANLEAAPEDLTVAEQEEIAQNQPQSNKNDAEYIFFIESILQSYLRVGMKLEATVRLLNCGIMFFDDVLSVHPTFDVYLPNEMVGGWKKPRPVKGAFDYESEVDDDDGEAEGVEDGQEQTEKRVASQKN